MFESAEGHTREGPDPPPAHPAPPPCTASSHMWERASLKGHTNLSHNSHSPEAFPLRHKSNANAEYTLRLNYSHQASIVSHTLSQGPPGTPTWSLIIFSSILLLLFFAIDCRVKLSVLLVAYQPLSSSICMNCFCSFCSQLGEFCATTSFSLRVFLRQTWLIS